MGNKKHCLELQFFPQEISDVIVGFIKPGKIDNVTFITDYGFRNIFFTETRECFYFMKCFLVLGSCLQNHV